MTFLGSILVGVCQWLYLVFGPIACFFRKRFRGFFFTLAEAAR